MSLDLRYLWSTRFVREELRAGRLSDPACFAYFWVIMVFDWLQFTLIATTPAESIPGWSAVSSWTTFAITALGLAYLFHQNGGRQGTHFPRRFFPLRVTVGWKFVVGMLVATWVIPFALAGLGEALTGWVSAGVLGGINLAMFWQIGRHLRALASESSPLNPETVLAPEGAWSTGDS